MCKHHSIIFIGQHLKELIKNIKDQGFEHSQFYAEYKSGIWRLSFIN